VKVAIISKADSFGGGASRVAETLVVNLNLIEGVEAIHINAWRGNPNNSFVNLFGKFSLPIRFFKKIEAKFGFIDIIPFELPALYLAICKSKIQVLHFHDLTTAISPLTLLVLSKKFPVVWTLHDVSPITAGCIYPFECNRYLIGCGSCPQLGQWPLLTKKDKTRMMQKIRKLVISSPRITLVTPSFWLKNLVQPTLLSNKEVKVISNGIKTSHYQPKSQDEVNNLRQMLSLKLDYYTFLIAAADLDDPRKGAKDAIDFLNKIEQRIKYQIIILGKVTNTFLMQLPSVPMHIAGYISNEKNKGDLFKAADAMIFTSKADNQPLVILESASSGHKIFSYPTGGIREIADYYPDLFLINNDFDLEKSKKKISEREFVSKTMSQRTQSSEIARKYFNMENHVYQYLDLYRKLKH
jgi:glycosyltransferase involved in cell wall biosynthesis